MNKSLGTIAALGFGLALIFFVLATMVSPNIFRGIGREAETRRTAASSKPGEKQFAWDGGDRLQIDMAANVDLMPGDTPSVIVRGDQDLVDQVILHNGKLSGGDADDCYIPFLCSGGHRRPLIVEVHGVQLKELRVNGVAQVDMGHIDQDRLTLRLSGAGKVEGEGRLDELDLSISGAGSAEFGGLMVGRARVNLSGVGNAEISPSQEADITISGVGNVRLDTKPANLIQHVSGVGNITGPGTGKSKDEDKDLRKQIRDQRRHGARARSAEFREHRRSEEIQKSVREKVDAALRAQGI